MSEEQQKPGGSASKVNLEDVPWEEFSSPKGRCRSRIRPLGSAAGSERIGFDVQVVPPGASSCPLHFHLAQEEFFWVLEGRGRLREWEEGEVREVPLAKGDVLAYPAGRKLAHEFLNDSDQDLVLFVAGERTRPEVCYYPDSDKWGASEIEGKFRAQGLDYWDGEEE